MNEFEQRVVDLYNSGLSKEKVAKQFGVSDKRVAKILKLNNVPNRKTLKDTIDLNQLKTDYESGIGTTTLAKKHNCSVSAITNILRNNGVEVKRDKDVADRLRDNRDYIVSMYSSGRSSYQIGKDLNIHDGQIYSFLRDTCGISMRSNCEKRFEEYGEVAKELFDSGMSIIKIAERIGCATQSVSRWLKSFKCDTSKYSSSRDIPLKTQSEDIIKDYLAGQGCTELSRKYDASETSITKIIRKAGIEPLYTRKYEVQHDYFENIDSWFKAYWLGWLVTDGNNDDMRSVRLCITDKDVCEKFNETLNNENPVKFVKRRKDHHKDQYKSVVNSVKMCEDLAKWGVIPNKTHHTYFPDIPEEFLAAFILGCTDGDGSILTKPNKNGTYNGCWSMVGNYELLIEMSDKLSQKLGIRFKFYDTSSTGNIKILRTRSRDETIKLLDYLYQDAPFFLTRKHDKYLQLKACNGTNLQIQD